MMKDEVGIHTLSGGEITQIFIKLKAGDAKAQDRLIHFLYQELKHIAASKRHSFKNSHTLNTTALVNETWLKLKHADLDYNDKNHFLSVAAMAMKQILLDDSRRKQFLRQRASDCFPDGDQKAGDALMNPAHVAEAEWLHQLDSIINKLEKHSPRLALVFNLKFFCGLSYKDLAEYFDVSEKTAQRDWNKAKSIVATTMSWLKE